MVLAGVDRGLHLRQAAAADGAGVHIGQVGGVQHIVDDQPGIASQRDHIRRSELPIGMISPPEIRNFRGVRESGIAGPDPDPMPALHHGEGAHARIWRDRGLAGDFHTFAGGVKAIAMVAATQPVALDLAQRQWQLPVAALIFQRGGRSVRAAKEDHVLPEDLARQRFARHFPRPGCHIPGITWKHSLLPTSFFQILARSSPQRQSRNQGRRRPMC